MKARFVLPTYLRTYANGEATVDVEASEPVVRAGLEALFERFPGLVDRVFTEQGEVRPHVNIFVGDESIRFTGGLETPLRDGTPVTILPAVSGGAG